MYKYNNNVVNTIHCGVIYCEYRETLIQQYNKANPYTGVLARVDSLSEARNPNDQTLSQRIACFHGSFNLTLRAQILTLQRNGL